jgi:hypothetical protein
VQFNGEWDRWTLQGRVIGSWWASGQDEDDHHLRTLLFTEKFGESNMVGANAHVGYRLTQNLLLKGEYDLQQWDLAKVPRLILITRRANARLEVGTPLAAKASPRRSPLAPSSNTDLLI